MTAWHQTRPNSVLVGQPSPLREISQQEIQSTEMTESMGNYIDNGYTTKDRRIFAATYLVSAVLVLKLTTYLGRYIQDQETRL